MSRRSTAVVAVAMLGAATAAAGQDQVFRAGVSAVTLDVSVRRGNRPVAGLAAADFVVHDNGVRQRVESVSMGEVPIDVTFFLGAINQSRAAELKNLESELRKLVSALRDDDRVRLMTLENAVVESFGWRTKEDANAALGVRLAGVQSLYDAIFVSLLHRPTPGRRHLVIVLTDGVEFGSVVDSAAVQRAAARTDAALYLALTEAPASPPAAAATKPMPVVRGAPAPTRTSTLAPAGAPDGYVAMRATWLHVLADERGMDRLFDAARSTGGEVREVEAGTSIAAAFREVFEQFQQGYLLRYTATGVPSAGWHEVKVEVANQPGYSVAARRGYFGGGGE